MSSKENLRELAARAAPIAKNAQLVSVELREITAKRSATPTEAALPEFEIAGSHIIDHRFLSETDDSGAQLLVDIAFTLRLRESSENTPLEIASLKAAFTLSYLLSRGMPEEAKDRLGAFSQTNALLHAWPYFRELAQSTAWRMGLPPISLPLFQLGGPIGASPAEVERG